MMRRRILRLWEYDEQQIPALEAMVAAARDKLADLLTEHGILRGNKSTRFVPSKTFAANDPRRALVIADPDPRIHFALHCGAKSCPPVAAYDPQNIDDQLGSAARAFLGGSDGISGEIRF